MSLIRSALGLAAKGLAVFPCAPRDKRPATSNGFKAATTNRTVIEAWWRQEPAYNIGIATGNVSGVFVVDVDGLDGEATLRSLEREYGALPPSVESITGGGGRHVFFRMPGTAVRNSAGKLGERLDVRGDGGYVVAPPSVHPCGRRYCWSVDSTSAFAAAPAWLLAKIAEPASGNGSQPARPPRVAHLGGGRRRRGPA